jgi:hypothetical protein
MIFKHIERQIKKDVFLFQIEAKTDANYFINIIDEKLKEKNNAYATNVKGDMTGWKAFNEDAKLYTVIQDAFTYLSKHHSFLPMQFKDSWGIRKKTFDSTIEHDHQSAHLSGVLYLSNDSPELIFPELNISVEPHCLTLVLFSPILNHLSPPNKSEESKYAVAFNLENKPIGDI